LRDADSTFRLGPVQRTLVIGMSTNVAMNRCDIRFNKYVAIQLADGANMLLKDCTISQNRFDINPDASTTVYTEDPSALSVGCMPIVCEEGVSAAGDVLPLDQTPQGMFLTGQEPEFVTLQRV
jgi:hypothetical protein